MVDVSLNVSGTEKIISALQKMPRATQRKVLRPGLRKGASIIRKQAVDNIRAITSDSDVSTGFLEKNVIVRAKKSKNGEFGSVVAVRGGVLNPKNKQRPGLYGSVLEFLYPWLRPAHRQKAQEAVGAISEIGSQKLNEAIEDAKRGL